MIMIIIIKMTAVLTVLMTSTMIMMTITIRSIRTIISVTERYAKRSHVEEPSRSHFFLFVS